ncbi:hypothetical protein DSO57_1021334 [Entomophthora muscae]|uniref:Uncharacterized protein n=1 Tax=Entomophthora muscae TaxID=34485 RepID=A0ACC2SS95_9FUNG|nr:hypothetical protein DSO57_1021334 [Entomophthora muscae]
MDEGYQHMQMIPLAKPTWSDRAAQEYGAMQIGAERQDVWSGMPARPLGPPVGWTNLDRSQAHSVGGVDVVKLVPILTFLVFAAAGVRLVYLDTEIKARSLTIFYRQEMHACAQKFMNHLCYSPSSVASAECEGWRRCMQDPKEVAWTPLLIELLCQMVEKISIAISVSPMVITMFLSVLSTVGLLASFHLALNSTTKPSPRQTTALGSYRTATDPSQGVDVPYIIHLILPSAIALLILFLKK